MTIQLVNNDWCNYVIASVYMLKIVNVFLSFNFVNKKQKNKGNRSLHLHVVIPGNMHLGYVRGKERLLCYFVDMLCCCI